MTWRVALSLATLRSEVRSVYPQVTVWTIGDPEHAASWSDHNPNANGVVCAADFLGGGLPLAWFANHVKDTNHVAVKYVIYNRRIWSKARDSEGWRAYHGSNPHTNHVHVSVGIGPDGRSTGPYDDRSTWGIVQPPNENEVPEVSITPRDVWRGFTGLDYVNDNATTKDHQLARAHQYTHETRSIARRLEEQSKALLEATAGASAEQILDRIDEHHAAVVAMLRSAEDERDALRDIVERGVRGELDAIEVVDEIARRLSVNSQAQDSDD